MPAVDLELAPPNAEITHPPTLELMYALFDAKWRITHMGTHHADLRHPYALLPIRVTMSEKDTSRVDRVLVGGTEMPIAWAIGYAKASH